MHNSNEDKRSQLTQAKTRQAELGEIKTRQAKRSHINQNQPIEKHKWSGLIQQARVDKLQERGGHWLCQSESAALLLAATA